MRMVLSCCLSILLMLGGAATSVAEPGPRSLVETTIDELVTIVNKYPGDDVETTRRAEMRKVIEPVFDFSEMAKRSLGPHWRNAEVGERDEFVRIFSDLLATTYLKKIEKIKDGQVEVKRERIREPNALVQTTVTYKGDVFPLDYKMLATNNGWRVYDVVIENIGLVKNYRNEFSGIIRREKFSGLLKRLKEKTQS